MKIHYLIGIVLLVILLSSCNSLFRSKAETADIKGDYVIVQQENLELTGGQTTNQVGGTNIVKDGIIIHTVYESSVESPSGKVSCSGTFSIDGIANNKCWTITCNGDEKKESCGFYTVLSEKDMVRKLEVFEKEVTAKRSISPDLEKALEIYTKQKGCNEILCYEDCQVILYNYNGMSWKRENTE